MIGEVVWMDSEFDVEWLAFLSLIMGSDTAKHIALDMTSQPKEVRALSKPPSDYVGKFLNVFTSICALLCLVRNWPRTPSLCCLACLHAYLVAYWITSGLNHSGEHLAFLPNGSRLCLAAYLLICQISCLLPILWWGFHIFPWISHVCLLVLVGALACFLCFSTWPLCWSLYVIKCLLKALLCLRCCVLIWSAVSGLPCLTDCWNACPCLCSCLHAACLGACVLVEIDKRRRQYVGALKASFVNADTPCNLCWTSEMRLISHLLLIRHGVRSYTPLDLNRRLLHHLNFESAACHTLSQNLMNMPIAYNVGLVLQVALCLAIAVGPKLLVRLSDISTHTLLTGIQLCCRSSYHATQP